MGTIRVTAAELRNRAEDLNESNYELKNVIEDFQQELDTLLMIWEGDACAAFKDAADKDKVQMENFTGVIDDFYKSLLIMARKYEAAERYNTDLANKRSC